jgi:hypothetical protein
MQEEPNQTKPGQRKLSCKTRLMKIVQEFCMKILQKHLVHNFCKQNFFVSNSFQNLWSDKVLCALHGGEEGFVPMCLVDTHEERGVCAGFG